MGLKRRFRTLVSYFNLFRFWLRSQILGFEVANLFIKRVDKLSVILILRRFGAKIGENCDIDTGLTFHNCNDYSNLIVGNNCHIGKNCFFDLREKVIIKDNVVISMQNTFITHTDLGVSNLSKIFEKDQKPILINNNCYLAANSTILAGVELENNSFVAAGAIVTNKVKCNTLVGGVPARELKDFGGEIHE